MATERQEHGDGDDKETESAKEQNEGIENWRLGE